MASTDASSELSRPAGRRLQDGVATNAAAVGRQKAIEDHAALA